MHIFLKKFGTILVSRPAGKEAYLAFQPILREIEESEPVKVDFEGVDVLTPSWADEFLTPLKEKFGGRVHYEHTQNPSVKATLDILEKIKIGL